MTIAPRTKSEQHHERATGIAVQQRATHEARYDNGQGGRRQNATHVQDGAGPLEHHDGQRHGGHGASDGGQRLSRENQPE